MQVYRTVCTGGEHKGRQVVIKVSRAGTKKKVVEKEIGNHVHLQENPNCMEVLDTLQTKNGPAMIVLPLCEGGSLAQCGDLCRNANYGRGRRPYTSLAIVIWQLLQVARGLAHIHAQNFVHADLKEENILLLDKKGLIVKVADFGLTVKTGKVIKGVQGSLPYIAPEILRSILVQGIGEGR